MCQQLYGVLLLCSTEESESSNVPQDILRVMAPARDKWYRIGRAYNIEVASLLDIRYKYRNSEDCYMNCLIEVLQKAVWSNKIRRYDPLNDILIHHHHEDVVEKLEKILDKRDAYENSNDVLAHHHVAIASEEIQDTNLNSNEDVARASDEILSKQDANLNSNDVLANHHHEDIARTSEGILSKQNLSVHICLLRKGDT